MSSTRFTLLLLLVLAVALIFGALPGCAPACELAAKYCPKPPAAHNGTVRG